MKFGIDINNNEIFSFVSEKLKDKENFVVDLRSNKNMSYGKALLKKVLIANITNIDIYFEVNFKEENNSIEIFYNSYNSSKIKAEKIKEKLSEKFHNANCSKDENLYLLKNINAEVIYLRVPVIYILDFEEKILEEMIGVLSGSE